MSSTLAPFIKWGDYHSKDKENPDVLEFKVSETETFETEYSTNIKVEQKKEKEWNEAILPLKSHESANTLLLQLWQKAVRDGLVKKGKKFVLKTWMGISKNNRPIRRFELEF
jgi:hypothetical protein